MTAYFALKFLAVPGAAVLLGTGAGIAFSPHEGCRDRGGRGSQRHKANLCRFAGCRARRACWLSLSEDPR
jgi:uncharacterized membrane protein